MTPVARGTLLVTLAAVVWSTGGLIARQVPTDAWTTLFWRGISCAAFLLGWMLAVEGGAGTVTLFRRVGWPGLACAACLATASTAFIHAVNRTSVANALVLQALAPFIAGLLGWLTMGERVTIRSLLAMAGALAGTVVMVSGSWRAGAMAGDLLAVVMATAFALGTVVVRRHRHVQMTPAVCLAGVLLALSALPLAAPASAGPRALALLAFFGAGQLGLGFVLFTAGARLVPAAQASLIAILESVLGPLWVWLALGEDPGPATWVGGAMVLTALSAHVALERPGAQPEARPARDPARAG